MQNVSLRFAGIVKAYFLKKEKKNIINLSSAELAHKVVRTCEGYLFFFLFRVIFVAEFASVFSLFYFVCICLKTYVHASANTVVSRVRTCERTKSLIRLRGCAR